MRLSDTIEAFIKAMLEEEEQTCELKRNELAEFFHCAPSQINYVLATRFTPDHGYITSSQRGGGGYIRIVRVQSSVMDRLAYLMNERIGYSLDEQSAQSLCLQLMENKIVSREEADLMLAALSKQSLSVPVPEEVKAVIRAKMMKNMLYSIAQRKEDKHE